VNHPPIDPTSPLPPHCDPKQEAAQRARWGASVPPPVAEAGQWKEAQTKKAGRVVPVPVPEQEIKSGGQAHEEL
jgi:hypothetical protein